MKRLIRKTRARHALGTAVTWACAVLLGGAGGCWAQPAITLSPTSGPPTSKLSVSGSGFAANAAVDIYFDTKDEALVSANGQGSFSNIQITAPGAELQERTG